LLRHENPSIFLICSIYTCSVKAGVLCCSSVFGVHPSQPCVATGQTIKASIKRSLCRLCLPTYFSISLSTLPLLLCPWPSSTSLYPHNPHPSHYSPNTAVHYPAHSQVLYCLSVRQYSRLRCIDQRVLLVYSALDTAR